MAPLWPVRCYTHSCAMKMLFDSWRRKMPTDAKADQAPSAAAVDGGASASVSAAAANGEGIASVTLELGDFLHRIPPGLLKEAAPDPKHPVRVEIAELAHCLTRGQSTTNLQHLFGKSPGLFGPDAPPLDGVEVLYPWQKILRLVAQPALGDGPGISVQHLLAEMKRCAATKAEPAAPAGKRILRGAVHRMRNAEREVSWMSVQKDVRRGAAGPELASAAPIRVNVPAETAREIPIRVEPTTASPTILRMPTPSIEPALPTAAAADERSGVTRVGTNFAGGGGGIGAARPDLALPVEMKLATMPDLAMAEEPPVSPAAKIVSAAAPAMEIPDLAFGDENAPGSQGVVETELAGSFDLEADETATIHFPALAGAMTDAAAASLPQEVAAPPAFDSGAKLAEVQRSLEAKAAELEVVQRELTAVREERAQEAKRHEAERAKLEQKVDEFIALGDAAVRERDARIAAQREQLLSDASAREESLEQERARAEAAAEAARAEAVILLEQARSASALEVERMRAELGAVKEEWLAANATREAEKAMAEGELAERDHQLAWNARTIEGLEADLEAYRNRIKAVLKQRDELAEEKKALAQQLANLDAMAAAKAQLEATVQAQAEAITALEGRLSGLASPAALQA